MHKKPLAAIDINTVQTFVNELHDLLSELKESNNYDPSAWGIGEDSGKHTAGDMLEELLKKHGIFGLYEELPPQTLTTRRYGDF